MQGAAADKGYEWQDLRDISRDEGVRPLINHREFRPVNSHVVRVIGEAGDRQRAFSGNSVFHDKTFGHIVRVRTQCRDSEKSSRRVRYIINANHHPYRLTQV